MFDLDALRDAGREASQNKKQNLEKFDSLFDNGLKAFKLYVESKNDSHFQNAVEFFYSALEIKSDKPELFLYIAYLFYISGQVENALDYLQAGLELDEHNQELLEFEEFISIQFDEKQI